MRRAVASKPAGPATYSAVAAASAGQEEATRAAECRWQRDRLPDEVRDLVLADQRRRNSICWGVFDTA